MMRRRKLTVAAWQVLAVASLVLAACAPGRGDGEASRAAPAPASAPPREGAAAAVASPAVPTASPTQSANAFDESRVAEFYRGKTVRILSGFAAGGISDLWARVLSRHIRRHIPGNPTVIVENKPGAGGLVMASALYNTEPKDGTVIGQVSPYLPLDQLLENPGVQLDSAKLHWLGASSREPAACTARTDSGISSIRDAIAGREWIIGSATTATDTRVRVLASTLGANIKLVSGYPGNAEIALAIEKGELHGVCTPLPTLRSVFRHQMEGERPTSKIVTVWPGGSDHPWLKDALVVDTLARTEEDRQLVRLIDLPNLMSTPWAVAPGVPEERVAMLRLAVAKTFADPEFVEEARKVQLDPDPRTAEEVTELVQEMFRMPPPLLTRLRELAR